MYLSKHVQQRMIERGLTINDIDLAIKYGLIVENKSREDNVVTFERKWYLCYRNKWRWELVCNYSFCEKNTTNKVL